MTKKEEPKQIVEQSKKEPRFYPHELMQAEDFYKERYLLALLDKNKKYTKSEAKQAIQERKK